MSDADAPAFEIVPERPSDAAALLRCWHYTLDAIDEDFTFGDLIALLNDVEDVGALSPSLDCDIEALIADAGRRRDEKEKDRVELLKVCNVTHLTHYEPDPSQPDEDLEWLDEDEAIEHDRISKGLSELIGEKPPIMLVDATADDPITGKPQRHRMRWPKQHGVWAPPYHLSRDFVGWGIQAEPYEGYFAAHPDVDPAKYVGAFAVELTPLSELLHLPLRYDPNVQFRSGKPGADELVFETQLTITFGEFLYAIFSELGFFGSPEDRDATRAYLIERVEALKRDEPETA